MAHAKIGPIPIELPWGKPWGLDAVGRERIKEATGVSVAMRQRPQCGPKFHLTASGPPNRLEEAIEMAKAVGLCIFVFIHIFITTIILTPFH